MKRSRSHEIIVEQNELFKFNEITTGIKLVNNILLFLFSFITVLFFNR